MPVFGLAGDHFVTFRTSACLIPYLHTKGIDMTNERALRIMAGCVVLLSAALTYFLSPWWLLLTAFVGLNLLQSGFTNWCPAMWIFDKIGLPRCCAPASKSAGSSCCSKSHP